MDLPVRWGPVENTAAWDAAVTVTTTERTGVARTAWILIPRMVAMNETMQIAERQMPDGDASVQHSAKVLAEAAPLVLRLLRELAYTNRRRHRSRLGQHHAGRARTVQSQQLRPRQLVREWEAGMEHHRRHDTGALERCTP